MNTKRYLEQIKRCEIMIKNKQEERKRIMDMGISTTVPTDRERVQTFGTSDLTGKAGTELALLSEQIDFLANRRAKIISQIDGMDELQHYEILTYRYVHHMSIFELMDHFGYSERHIERLLKAAHVAFEEKYRGQCVFA